MKRATKCPSCAEPVSVFAAGCAICGGDLEQHRRELDARYAAMPHVRAEGVVRRALRRIGERRR